MVATDWGRDSKPIREYVAMANADGYRPATIDNGRSLLLRYSKFVKQRYAKTLNSAGWREFAAYKQHLLTTGIKRTTIRSHLSYVAGFYLLKAQATQSPRYLECFAKMQVLGMTRRARSVPWKPYAPDTLRRILRGAKSYSTRRKGSGQSVSEDYLFLMTLLYTGGRAQFYGLRVNEVDLPRMEIATIIKGGRKITIPLHPRLERLLRRHLATRGYTSEFLFRHGKDPETRLGQKCNRQNAWRACKRAQLAAGLSESVHPHRFRKTLGSMGRKLGMDVKFLQAILGHMNPLNTLSSYLEPDMEDVKREFAKLDLVGEPQGLDAGSASGLINALRGMAPRGKENPWNAILDSLVSLFDEKTPMAGGMVQYLVLPDTHHDLTKTGRTLRIGNRVQFIMPTKRQGARWTGRER